MRKQIKRLIKFILVFSIFNPMIAFAQITISPTPEQICSGDGLGFLLCNIQQLLNAIVPVLIALGVVYFVWGVVQYVIADADEAKKKGKDHVIYGIIGLTVIVGLWGLVGFIVSTFSLSGGIAPSLASTEQATQACSGEGLRFLLCNIQQLLNAVVPVLIALGVVYFVWGVVQYVIADADEAKKKGKDRVIFGIIGLTVIVGLRGLVGFVASTFGLDSASAPILEPLTGISSTCSLDGSPKLQDVLCYITRIINDSVIPLLFALAIAYFVWGVVQFVILGAGEEAKRTQGRQHMIWGVIALAVMLGIWALVGILGSSFGIDTSVLPKVKP